MASPNYVTIFLITLIALTFQLTESKFLKPKKNETKEPPTRHPVIFVPAFGASEIHVKKPEVSNEWYTIWVNVSQAFDLDRFIDDFKREFDPKTGTTRNVDGVETFVPGWGDTSTVEYLVKLPFDIKFGYFDLIIDRLEEKLGYKRGRDIRAAPYDFRLAPYEYENFFNDLEQLIEDTYHNNRNQSIILMCHSMGCLHSYNLLLSRSDEWKEKHIKSWIPIGGPFGGSADALRTIAHGGAIMAGTFELKLGVLGLNLAKTFSSIYHMLPDVSVWPESQVIMEVDGQELTTKDMKKVLDLLKYDDGYKMWSKSKDMFTGYRHPGVEVRCIVGHGSPTPLTLKYNDTKHFPLEPEVVKGDGDGTVNQISNDICKKWVTIAKENMKDDPRVNGSTYESFKGVGHVALIREHTIINHVIDEIESINGSNRKLVHPIVTIASTLISWWLSKVVN